MVEISNMTKARVAYGMGMVVGIFPVIFSIVGDCFKGLFRESGDTYDGFGGVRVSKDWGYTEKAKDEWYGKNAEGRFEKISKEGSSFRSYFTISE